jgi:haloalkane dehalogenase
MQYTKRYKTVLGSRMAYIDEGAGDTILFLHGNPTSSFIWRNIIPHLTKQARCVAPDLIGMGDSDKLTPSGPDRYRFVEHRKYLDALYGQLDLGDRVVVVGQDWGSALAFDWAYRNQDRLKGIVHTESIPCAWTRVNFPIEGLLDAFLALRSPAGEELVLNENRFVEATMPTGTARALTQSEMAEYRRPFREPGEARRATLTWPREVPFEGLPADTDRIIGDYAAWLPSAKVPKLFIDAEPGFIVTGKIREWVRGWANQQIVSVKSKHFVQEDAPDEIGRTILEWYARLAGSSVLVA